MTYEQQFLDALKSIFVGAKVEGESGYINLMKIKASYFENGVFPQLMKDIDAACKAFEKGFREELFDKLYDFFQHYFSESGSIYFRNTAQHHNIYEKVYTDDRDVMLFWKTHMLYYVKTDRLFNSMDVEVDGEKFFFDVSGMELKRANEKRELTYTFKSYRDGKTTLTVGYSEKGRKTKVDDILKAVKAKGVTIEEETLEKAFRVFEKQSEVDYFINKNARAFLCEQFDLWMYQYLFKGESVFNETRLQQLKAIQEIAYKIIDFIAQFEDELVRVWNKPKFVLNSNYVITLDKIANGDEALLKKIFKHKGMKDQIAEWQELGMVNQKFKPELVFEKNLLNEPAHPHYQYLPLDTKYFKDVELDILKLFDDLDASLDGWLVHSENYQALTTLLPKFRERVNVIYIDPPYNTDASPIIYANNYRTSSWLSLMHNRLSIARDTLKDDGIICITIDDNQQKELHSLVEMSFGKDSIAGTVAIRINPSGRPTQTGFALQHEYAIFARNNDEAVIRKMKRSEQQQKRFAEQDQEGVFEWRNLRREGSNSDRDRRRRLYYPIVVNGKSLRIPKMDWDSAKQEWVITESIAKDETIVYPLDDDGREKTWRWGHQRVIDDVSLFMVKQTRAGKYNVYYKNYPDEEGTISPTIWMDPKYSATEHGTGAIKNLFGDTVFSYPKSVYAVEDCIDIAGLRDDTAICLDFFAGSGTTAHAVMNLNRADDGRRKYILIEMGEYFNRVSLPRVKKVVYSDKWKDGKAQPGKGVSHFAKYFELEQYEDTLRKARYEDAPLFAGTQDAYTSYVFLRDLKLLDAVKVDKKKNKVEVDLEKLYTGIDLAETLSCLTGKWIKRITEETVEFQDGTTASLSEPKWEDVKPLVWW